MKVSNLKRDLCVLSARNLFQPSLLQKYNCDFLSQITWTFTAVRDVYSLSRVNISLSRNPALGIPDSQVRMNLFTANYDSNRYGRVSPDRFSAHHKQRRCIISGTEAAGFVSCFPRVIIGNYDRRCIDQAIRWRGLFANEFELVSAAKKLEIFVQETARRQAR